MAPGFDSHTAALEARRSEVSYSVRRRVLLDAIEDLRCPVHGIPDCSPLLNGCSRVTGMVDELARLIRAWKP